MNALFESALTATSDHASAEAFRRRLSGWVASNPLAVVTLVGVALYGLIRLGHQTFYSEFGLSPEDVGIGYGEALSRAAGFAVYLVGAILFSALVLYAVEGFEAPGGKTVVGFLLGASLALLVFLTVTILFNARAAANDVKEGKAVRPPFIWDYGIHAEPARIAWHDEAPASLRRLSSRRLMLLGSSAGTVAFYDVRGKRTLRIPANAITVSLIPDPDSGQ